MKLHSLLKNKEVKNAGWLIGGRVVQMLVSLVVGVLTARYLGPDNYGLINYGTAFVTFFAALSTLGLNSVIVKDFVDHPDEQAETLGSALLMRVVSSVLSVIMIVEIVSILDHGEPITIVVVALCSVGSIFHVFEVFNYWFQYQYKSKVTAVATLTAYIVTSIYKITLLVLGKDVRWFAAASSVDYIVVAVFLWIAYKKHGGPPLRASFHKARDLIRVSYNYIISSLMVAIYVQTDKLMLKQILNETEVGYYSMAAAICAMWTFVLQAIIDSVYPTILSLKDKDYEGYLKKNRQLYAIIFYVSFAVSIAFCILGDWVVRILYGEAYAPAIPVLKIATWYTAFSYLGVARNAWIICEGKQRFLKYLYGWAVIINIALNAIMIPYLGASGAALASLITQMFTSILLPLCFTEMRPNAKLMLEAIFLRNLR